MGAEGHHFGPQSSLRGGYSCVYKTGLRGPPLRRSSHGDQVMSHPQKDMANVRSWQQQTKAVQVPIETGQPPILCTPLKLHIFSKNYYCS